MLRLERFFCRNPRDLVYLLKILLIRATTYSITTVLLTKNLMVQ
jgi:hypothetical protein